ncbi:MAG: hypothetical protein Q9187_002919 [Circinaria calcarea]
MPNWSSCKHKFNRFERSEKRMHTKGIQYIGEQHRALEQKETAQTTPYLQLPLEETSETKFPKDVTVTMQSSKELQQGEMPQERTWIHNDQANTPMSETSNSTKGPAVPSTFCERCADTVIDRADETNVYPGAAPHGTSSMCLASLTSASNPSSPLHSTYTSSNSLQSSHPGSPLREGLPNLHSTSSGLGNQSVLGLSSPIDSPLLTKTASPISSGPISSLQAKTQQRQEGPRYPDQSFAALQTQYHPPPYQPHPSPSRDSQTSAGPSYSSGSAMKSRDRSSKDSGARTTGHTPAHSPGLFVAAYPKDNATDDDTAETHYSIPLLHPTHLQAPKETHKLLKDIDPISGRKIINNYEFHGKLGSGAHGTVKLGRNLLNDKAVAIKIVRRFSKKVRLGKQETPEDRVKKEVAILKKARHPHIVSLNEVIDDPVFNKVYLILEFIDLGEISWRKLADEDVARFELDRVKREMSGQINDAFEAELIARFNEGVEERRAEKKELLSHQMGQAKERLLNEKNIPAGPKDQVTTMPDPWSIEFGAYSEEERERGTKLHSQSSVYTEKPDTSAFPTPTGDAGPDTFNPNPGSSASQESLRSLQDYTDYHYPVDTESAFVLPALAGTTWEPYTGDEANSQAAKIRFQSTLHQVIAEQAQWPEEDEEFLYAPCLTLSQALEAFRDTVLGLEYLHYQGIIHRDIKPANLLWTKDHRVKISDFGVSYLGRPIREDENKEEIEEADAANLDEAIELAKTVGTPAFYAPELCDPELFDVEKNPVRPQINGQIDVWALGVTLYGMIFGRLPFYDVNEFAMYEKIARQEVFIPLKRLKAVEDGTNESKNINNRLDDVLEYDVVDDELRDLLKRLLHKKPTKRITLKEVKHHPWVLQGIKNQSAWIDETDPSLQSEGKKIEVSSQEVSEAVIPLTIVDRIKSGIRRLGSVVRGRDSRKRGESNVKPVEESLGEPSKDSGDDMEGRRTSLRGDEQIISALRASRETTEHPLAQSVVASPEGKEHQSYFTEPVAKVANVTNLAPGSPNISSLVRRPSPPGRVISNTESMKTIRARISSTATRDSTPPPIENCPVPSSTPVIDTHANTSSGLSGIFGGAGRRFVKSMRSRERNTHGRDNTSATQSSRSSSIENMVSVVEDPHAGPSIAFSLAYAAGHVDQPPVLREESELDDQTWPPLPVSPQTPGDFSNVNFQRAQEQNYRRHVHEAERLSADTGPRSKANTVVECPPSPDDETFYARQQPAPPINPTMGLSSSDDLRTSEMSESFSYPSIPSVVSGTSSLSTAADEQQYQKRGSLGISTLSIDDDFAASIGKGKSRSLGPPAPEDDEAGYNGDGDEGEYDSDDEGIVFGGERPGY